MTNRQSIDLSINGRYLEGIAATGSAIIPGQLLRRTTVVGEVNTHATADGPAQQLIAIENQLEGKSIDDPYAEGDTVYIRLCLPGDRFLGRLNTGQSVTAGKYLTSAGNGNLKAVPAPPVSDDAIVGCALEAVDASAGVARIAVEVM